MLHARINAVGAVRRFAVVVAALVVSANSCAASCGDYVHIARHADRTNDDATPSPPDSPCANGKCDRPTPDSPTPNPGATPTGSPGDMLLPHIEVEDERSTSARLPNRHATRPNAVASAIFHPPRG